MTSCNQILYVIEQAMSSHDNEAAYWLERITALQDSPEGQHHARALAIVRGYLEELTGRRPGASTEAAPPGAVSAPDSGGSSRPS